MKSKERVQCAFSHEEPDRVPIDYYYNPGIDARLKEHYGLALDDSESLRRRLGVDFREVGVPYVGPDLHDPVEGRKINEWGIRCRWIEHESGGYWDYCDFPLQGASLEEIENWPMPSPDHYDYDCLESQCARFGEFWVYIGNPGLADLINGSGMVLTMEQVLMDLALGEKQTLRYMERRAQVQLEVLEKSLEKVRGKMDMVFMGEDLGTQIGPLISLELYRKHLRPIHERFISLARAYDLPVMVHSCGSSSWAFDDFIEMGVTAVDTLQPEAQDMQPAYLKKNYGHALSFHGCISTAGPVVDGSVQETVDDARNILEIMMPDGGYAFSPTHQLQDNSRTENVVALYEAAHKYGRY